MRYIGLCPKMAKGWKEKRARKKGRRNRSNVGRLSLKSKDLRLVRRAEFRKDSDHLGRGELAVDRLGLRTKTAGSSPAECDFELDRRQKVNQRRTVTRVD